MWISTKARNVLQWCGDSCFPVHRRKSENYIKYFLLRKWRKLRLSCWDQIVFSLKRPFIWHQFHLSTTIINEVRIFTLPWVGGPKRGRRRGQIFRTTSDSDSSRQNLWETVEKTLLPRSEILFVVYGPFPQGRDSLRFCLAARNREISREEIAASLASVEMGH